MGRSPCCVKVGLKRGPWSPEEDRKLTTYIQQNGHGNWSALPAKAGLRRCGKSCRLRWINYLRTDIKRGKFSLEEDRTIIQLHALLGNKWSIIAAHLPKRTDNEIKNYWNTHLKKRLTKMGIDPMTHKPKFDHVLPSALSQHQDAAYLSHMAQWETARLQAEARLVRESKFQLAPSSCSKPAPFVLKKNPAQPPLPPSSWSWFPSLLPSKPDNNVNMHNYAVLLATNDFDSSIYGHANQNSLPSPNNANSLDFTKTSASRQADYVKDAEESIGEKVMEENGLLQDDDIMVALEALRASPYNNTNNISVGASNSVFEGLCVPAHDSSYEKIDLGKGSDNESSCNKSFEDNLDYWNNLLNLGE